MQGPDGMGEMHIVGVTKKELERLIKKFPFEPISKARPAYQVLTRAFKHQHDDHLARHRVSKYLAEEI